MFNARKLKNAMIKLAIFKTAIFNFICKKSTIVKNNIFKIYKRKKAACNNGLIKSFSRDCFVFDNTICIKNVINFKTDILLHCLLLIVY